jgi:FAD/FMN-containing dehydrogenase
VGDAGHDSALDDETLDGEALDGEAFNDEALNGIVAVVGDAHVLTDPGVTAGHCIDWTGRFHGSTPAVVRPGSTDEVAGVLKVCNRHGVAVVPQGGNTGLVGGGVPLGGEIVLNLGRLTHLGPVDAVHPSVTVGAGVTIADLQRHAAASGLAYGVDLAARDSATVGGTIATNAGGLRVIRWGATRAQLLGIEAVMADGTIVSHLGGLVKDNTGYDLGGLVCGSEGTLAVVTAARLRLIPQYAYRTVALVGFADVAAAIKSAASWATTIAGVEAIEFFLADGLDLVCDTSGMAMPFDARWDAYVLVEAASDVDPTDAMATVMGIADGIGDVAVGRTTEERSRLWSYREGHTESINRLGSPHKLDVTLPHAALAGFIDEVPAAVSAAAPDARTWLFGHVGDGNVHVNVTGVAPADNDVDDVVLRLVAGLGGSISAEHGIGTAKKAWLSLNRSPAELGVFAAIKSALDPVGILNPNVLIPEEARPTEVRPTDPAQPGPGATPQGGRS